MENEIKTYSDIIVSIKDLLESFKSAAPGTYRHCEVVAELCETICEDITELNKDNLVLAARLHDIGKMCQPEWFTENQVDNVNPHDNIDTSLSYQIISRHVGDSLTILINHDTIPRKVLEIISQHHGSTCIRSLANKDKGNCDKFRYKSKRPQTIEACVLMICDVVEAATKSMFTNNKLTNIEVTVNKLIDNLINDCQIDCLTIGQLRQIRKILVNSITNIYHTRTLYNNEDELTDDVSNDSTSI